MKVEPFQYVELKIPPNVHEIILVEDSLLGRIRKKAYENASTLWFFIILWFVVLAAEILVRVIWN